MTAAGLHFLDILQTDRLWWKSAAQLKTKTALSCSSNGEEEAPCKHARNDLSFFMSDLCPHFRFSHVNLNHTFFVLMLFLCVTPSCVSWTGGGDGSCSGLLSLFSIFSLPCFCSCRLSVCWVKGRRTCDQQSVMELQPAAVATSLLLLLFSAGEFSHVSVCAYCLLD